MRTLQHLTSQPYAPAVLVFLVCYVYICAAKRFRATVLWAGVAVLLLFGTYRPDGGGLIAGIGDLLCNINWNVLMILAGAMTVAVLCGFGERAELERLEPDLVLNTTANLMAHLPDEKQTWPAEW